SIGEIFGEAHFQLNNKRQIQTTVRRMAYMRELQRFPRISALRRRYSRPRACACWLFKEVFAVGPIVLILVAIFGSVSAAQKSPSGQVKAEGKSTEGTIRNHSLLRLSQITNTDEKSATVFTKLQDERRWAVFELDRVRANVDRYRTTATQKPEIVELLDQQNYEADLQKINEQVKDADNRVKQQG